MNNDLMTNGVLDLGKLREKKEAEAKAERFKAIASQIEPVLYLEMEDGEEREFEVMLTAITDETVLLMLRGIVEQAGEEAPVFEHMFAAIPHDGTALSTQIRVMTDEEFREFQEIMNSYQQFAEMPDAEDGDDPATLGTTN